MRATQSKPVLGWNNSGHVACTGLCALYSISSIPDTSTSSAQIQLQVVDHFWAVECDAVVMWVRCNQIVLAATAWFESFCWGGHVVVVAGLRRDYTAWRKKYSTTLHIIWMYRLDYIGPSLTNMKKLHLTLNTVNWSHILTYDSLSSSSLQTS